MDDLMDKQEALSAILIEPQLERLCKEFNLRIEDLEPNFEGWSKLVIMAPDLVFLFPRHLQFNEELEKECEIYRAFNDMSDVPLPRLVKMVDDQKMSYHKFGVTSRLKGVSFSSMEAEFGEREYETLLGNLGRLIAVWHELPLENIPKVVGPMRPDDHGKLADEYRWILEASSPATVDETLASVVRMTEVMIDEFGCHEYRAVLSDGNKRKWREVFRELTKLDEVLVHGDVASEQIIVRSVDDLEITGIVDWSTAAVAHPLFDFNFWEWDHDIWRFRGSFQRLRRAMWKAYLEARGISLSTLEGLHLLYMLLELYWIAKTREPLVDESLPLNEELRVVLRELEEVTLSI
jgi:aminoglycoside phosphotransferase (APT) family kinase protein